MCKPNRLVCLIIRRGGSVINSVIQQMRDLSSHGHYADTSSMVSLAELAYLVTCVSESHSE